MTKTAVSDAGDLPNDRDALARFAEEDPDPQRQRVAFELELNQRNLDVIAHIAGHDPIEWRRNAAFERLLPCINRIAQVWFRRRFSKTSAVQDMVNDAPSAIWEHISSYDSERGHFPGWCKVVLYRWALDAIRGSGPGSESLLPEPPDPGPRPGPSDEDIELLKVRLIQQRVKLDEIRWLPQKGEKNVHYFAVLLVQLRLRLARKVAGTIQHRDRSEFIAECLPRRTQEGTYVLKPGWPTIMAIWTAFKKPLDQPPNYLKGAEACLRIDELRGGGTVALFRRVEQMDRASQEGGTRTRQRRKGLAGAIRLAVAGQRRRRGNVDIRRQRLRMTQW